MVISAPSAPARTATGWHNHAQVCQGAPVLVLRLLLASAVAAVTTSFALPAYAQAGTPMSMPASSQVTAVVTARNPNALFQHDVSITAPRAATLCQSCVPGDTLDLGTLNAGEELKLTFTITPPSGDPRTVSSDTSDAVTVTPTVVAGRATGWIVNLEDGGGPPEDLTVEIRFASTAPAYTYTGPDYKVVRYIRDFPLAGCVKSYVQNYTAPVPATVACAALKASHNPVPGAGIDASPAAWSSFLGSKEYRTVLHLPRYSVRCSGDGFVLGLPSPNVAPYRSNGYTPMPGGKYVGGEPYKEAGGVWDVDPPEMEISPDRRSVRLTHRTAVRAASFENRGGVLLLAGRTLPFVWTVVEQDLRCARTAPTVITVSDMPSTRVYRDSVLAADRIQTSDLGGFHESGGTFGIISHVGVLSPACEAIYFDVPPSAARAAACEDKRSYGGGLFGAGWLTNG